MFRAFVAVAIMLGLVAQAPADYRNLAAGCLESSRKGNTPAPVPAPSPAPSGVCDNCNGVGKIGDGTIMLTCPVCNGTGKKTIAVEPASWPNYPVRSRNWSYPGNIQTHLQTGDHSGLFDPQWLATQSKASLESLHSDHHENRVKWEFVVRAKAVEAKPKAKTSTYNCPGGNCPTRWGFGIFR
jgi:hypothetical protein